MEFAKSEAKSEGSEISNSAAFDAAMKLGFSDFQSETKGKAAQAKAKERAAKAQNQPRGMNGRFGSDRSREMTDAEREEEALKELTGFFKEV